MNKKIECPACGGTGVQHVPCGVLNSRLDPSLCFCGGEGSEESCSRCAGTGVVEVPATRPEETVCPQCEGSGTQVPQREFRAVGFVDQCARCRGTGRVLVETEK